MEFVKFLGKGSYGSVNLFRYRTNDGSINYTAVKTSDSLTREFQILTKLKDCPNIVQLLGDTLSEGFDFNGNKVHNMSMEYARIGTLTKFIKSNGRLSDSMIRDFTRMILKGLVSIHNLGYVHCDLKPDNLLLFPVYDENWNCSYDLKISDFGLSKKAGEDSDTWEFDSPFIGTPVYMSPESVQYGVVEKPLDLWSLGCIVLEMYTGLEPWFEADFDEVKSLLLNRNKPKIPESLPWDARQFLEKCFDKVKRRGTASELLLHPFLSGDRKMVYVVGGERGSLVLRIRKPPQKKEDMPKKTLKLKIISSKAQQFKKVTNKPLKVKFLPPRPLRVKIIPPRPIPLQ